MNKTRWMIGLLVLGVLGMVVLQEIKAMESKSKQQAVKMQRKVTLELEYLLALPKDYDKDTTKAWPLMVFLHGAGERGSDMNRSRCTARPS